jgi:hypothetical protein
MTFAPPTLIALGRYWRAQGGVLLGIVGDTAHATKGISYHLGESQLTANAYSRRTARDKAGLSEAASAIDLGRLDGTFNELRDFSEWLVRQCQSNAEGTRDVREVIYSPDGVKVLRYDREEGIHSDADEGEADASHRTHTHVSFYRDSQGRDKVGLFRPYFEPEEDMQSFTLIDGPAADIVVKDANAAYLRLKDGSLHKAPVGMARKGCIPIKLLEPISAGKPNTDEWTLGRLIGVEAAFLLERNLTVTPIPVADCSAQDAKLAQIHTLSA